MWSRSNSFAPHATRSRKITRGIKGGNSGVINLDRAVKGRAFLDFRRSNLLIGVANFVEELGEDKRELGLLDVRRKGMELRRVTTL